jgi:hypothetical protein
MVSIALIRKLTMPGMRPEAKQRNNVPEALNNTASQVFDAGDKLNVLWLIVKFNRNFCQKAEATNTAVEIGK